MFNFQLLKMLSTSFVQMYPAVASYFHQVLSLKPYFFFSVLTCEFISIAAS